MHKIDAYKASDGGLFETEEACQAHEVSLRWRGEINTFLDSDICPYARNTAQAGMVHKTVVAWEMFKESRTIYVTGAER